ncbi:hypothetical protein AMAG_16589 [Allomyces macrogynus ATCC 38327]|uniref:RNI-like protein n=1 Tax=Allomyces macrogynus (strain ATCC 38327) TaxID=578462 RepID=A0A0L0TBM1_ALLM3|nr:hypothetical protein AMAG_16589 [Allomyces macrogynus ATCC 38327]|eukprot:KNE72095.1 hypothetical protein AMAG_16589 [Allomyces macrogynus ATCC 38327]
MARIPVSVKSLHLDEHLTPDVLRRLAAVPRPHLVSIELHGITDARECLQALASMLHVAVTKLSLQFVSGTVFDESAWATLIANGTPKLREVRLAGCTMTSGGVARVIGTLPTDTLFRIWLDVRDLGVIVDAAARLLARDWDKLCGVGFAGPMNQLPTKLRVAMESRGWKTIM